MKNKTNSLKVVGELGMVIANLRNTPLCLLTMAGEQNIQAGGRLHNTQGKLIKMIALGDS